MAKDFAKKFYKSKNWQSCRASYISKRIQADGGLCEVCRARQGYIVHHTEHLTPTNIRKPEISLAHDKLSYECKICHDKHEGHGVASENAWHAEFDDEGNPTPLKEGKPCSAP